MAGIAAGRPRANQFLLARRPDKEAFGRADVVGNID
jgi:hypothetical protein